MKRKQGAPLHELPPEERWRISQRNELEWWVEFVSTELGSLTTHDQLAATRFAEGRYALERFFGWHDYQFSRQGSPIRGKLLDVGCAVASFFEFAPQTAVVAIDPLLDRLAAKLAPLVVTGKVNNCDYRSCVIQDIQEEDFDIVWCFNTLDHACDWQDILWHCRRVLKPGGQLLLEADCRFPGHLGDQFHMSRFTAEELIDAVEDVGLETQWHSKIQPLMIQYQFNLRAVRPCG